MYSSLEVPGMILLFFKKTLFFVLKDMVRCSFKRVLEFRAQTISLLPPLALISPHFRKREKNISKMPAGRSSPSPEFKSWKKRPFLLLLFAFFFRRMRGKSGGGGGGERGLRAELQEGREERKKKNKLKSEDKHEEIRVHKYFLFSYFLILIKGGFCTFLSQV